MADIHQLKTNETTTRQPPVPILRPCDYSLLTAVNAMEIQVGTVEAYNKLCDAAAHLKAQIDRGDAKQAMTAYATDPAFIYPGGNRNPKV